MIGKGKAISHTKASINYGWNDEKDAKFILKQNVIGDTPAEITSEFKLVQGLNEKCTRNTFSFVLSPTIEDGQQMRRLDFLKVTRDFIAEMKLQEHQAVAFVHNDKEHKHIHLYVNRIDFTGKAYKDSYVGKKAQKIAEKVALKNQLTTVLEVKEKQKKLHKVIRSEVFKRHQYVLGNRVEGFEDYIKQMEQSGVHVKAVINKDKCLQGFRFLYKGESFKGSEIHRSMSINRLALGLKKMNPSLSLSSAQFNKQTVSLQPSIKDYLSKHYKEDQYGKNRSADRVVGR